MLTDKRVIAVFQEFAKNAPTATVSLQIHDYDHPFVGSYDAKNDVIHLDVTKINNTDFSFQFEGLSELNFTIEDYMKVILAHEFGHALDRQNILSSATNESQWKVQLENAKEAKVRKVLISKLTALHLKYETNAWKLGESALPKELMPLYKKVQDQKLFEGIQNKRREFESLVIENT